MPEGHPRDRTVVFEMGPAHFDYGSRGIENKAEAEKRRQITGRRAAIAGRSASFGGAASPPGRSPAEHGNGKA